MSVSSITQLLKEHYGLQGELRSLVGYANPNYMLTTSDGTSYIVKGFSKNAKRGPEVVRGQMEILDQVHESWDGAPLPRPIRSLQDHLLESDDTVKEDHLIGVLTWLDGELLKDIADKTPHFGEIGSLVGRLDNYLNQLDNVAIRSWISTWDPQHALQSKAKSKYISDPNLRRIVNYFYLQYDDHVAARSHELRMGLIHCDVNDYNIVLQDSGRVGLIDFGDMVYSHLINELAIMLTYLMLDAGDLDHVVTEVVGKYCREFPIDELEAELLYHVIGVRIAVSLSKSAHAKESDPDNTYLQVSERPMVELAYKWIRYNPQHVASIVLKASGLKPRTGVKHLLEDRQKFIAPSFSISYNSPIEMESAAFQYMYAADGTTYLDCVNNICHVGHCHPEVVEAGSKQMARLNTNTRYLYDSLAEYAAQLTAKLPPELDTVFFVNSGSEAGDLAQRIARTVTGSTSLIVIDHGYHGNTLAGIDASPYKFKGPGGSGAASHIQVLDMPDGYRGKYSDTEDPLAAYLADVDRTLSGGNDQRAPIFYAESIIGCGGQVVLPQGYLQGIYDRVRQRGGLCIADEVQVGFGRVGETFWGFELQSVVPDLVVMGKPMGNGHPLAAVVTTHKIAEAFDTGMEFFSSFGGNPVSCEIGKAVLRVLDQEDLQNHALEVGQEFKRALQTLQKDYECIGDVRGYGLFLGIEFVEDRDSKTPWAAGAKEVVELMKGKGVLLSTDGPDNNVIKIKPPLPFSKENVEQVVWGMEHVLKGLTKRG